MRSAMKKTAILLVCVLLLFLSACGGNVEHVDVLDWQSEIYTDAEIASAIRMVKDSFFWEFEGGCTLTALYYSGDDLSDECSRRAANYGADEAIIICSNFDVDSSGGDGSLEPNATYEGWQWTLVRSHGGKWRHADHGCA